MDPCCHPPGSPPGRNAAAQDRRTLEPGETLYQEGAACEAMFALRSGCLKVLVADGAGGAHIVRFLLPGDVAGLDAHGRGYHRSSAQSVGPSEVCRHVGTVADIRSRLAGHLRACVGDELDHAQRHAAALARLDAAQRMARFLLELSGHRNARGRGNALPLPMSRREIGEHLGITMETASRLLGLFRARGWIELPPHAVVIRDAGALREAAAEAAHP